MKSETRKVELKVVESTLQDLAKVREIEAINGWSYLCYNNWHINDIFIYFERPIKEEKKEDRCHLILDGRLDYNTDERRFEWTVTGIAGDWYFWDQVHEQKTAKGWELFKISPPFVHAFTQAVYKPRFLKDEKQKEALPKEKCIKLYDNLGANIYHWGYIYEKMTAAGWTYIRSDSKQMFFERDQPKPVAFDTGVGTSCVGDKYAWKAIENLWLGNRRPKKESTDRPYNSNVKSERYWPKVHDLMTKQGWTYISTDACRMYFERDVKQESYIQKTEREVLEKLKFDSYVSGGIFPKIESTFQTKVIGLLEDLLKTVKKLEGKV